jgi:hypothetical protein
MGGAPFTTVLSHREGVELASAWAQHLARSRGIRLLLIKGDALYRYGLRAPRASADVDLLVEPARFDEFCDVVVSSGWRTRPMPFIHQHTSPHSRAFLRDGWPCDVDIHSYFPGFIRPSSEVFDTLWSRRQSLVFAQTNVDCPDRMSSILVLGLHSLRDGAVDARHRSELIALAAIDLSEDERSDLAGLAAETGSAGTLTGLLHALRVEVRPGVAELAADDLREWKARVTSGSAGAYAWFLMIKQTSWRRRLPLAWNAVWPTDTDMRISHPDIGSGASAMTKARFARWTRGVRGIPRSLRALRSRCR